MEHPSVALDYLRTDRFLDRGIVTRGICLLLHEARDHVIYSASAGPVDVVYPRSDRFFDLGLVTKGICLLLHEDRDPTHPASAEPVAVDCPRAGAVSTAFALCSMNTGGDYGFCRRVSRLCSQCRLITFGGGNQISFVKKSCRCSCDELFGWWSFGYSETIRRRGRDLLLQTKAPTYAEFRRLIWEIDDVVSILPHNPDCQPDVCQLFDDTSTAKSSEGDIMSIIVEESEQFPLSSPSR